jgi:hypothetical protein
VSQFVDFGRIKTEISMEKALDYLRLPITKWQGRQIRTACPYCQRGGDTAISINADMNIFTCFPAKHAGMKTGSDVIALVAHVRGIGHREAGALLQEHFFGVRDEPKRTNKSSQAPLPTSTKTAEIHRTPMPATPPEVVDEGELWEAFISRL